MLTAIIKQNKSIGKCGGPFGGYRDDICGRLLGMKVVMRMVRFERIFFG